MIVTPRLALSSNSVLFPSCLHALPDLSINQGRNGPCNLHVTAAKHAKEEITGHLQGFVSNYAKGIFEAHKNSDSASILKFGKQLEAALGENIARALRRYDITRLRQGQPPGVLPTRPDAEAPQNRQKTDEQTPRYLSEDEMIEARKKRVAEADARWRQSHR